MCQLKETGLQSVSVLNTIPKFTVNHSQKGKAGTDRLFQGCDSRSTTPAQPLHPSAALCELTTFYQSHKLGLRNTLKKKALFLNFIPHDLYSPSCPLFREAQATTGWEQFYQITAPVQTPLAENLKERGAEGKY